MSDKKLVLVIDDDPDIVSTVETILTAEGFSVVTAMSGEEGIKAFSTNKPDLVLCDMMMERIDAGNKVANEIRKVDDKVPVYLMSSIGDATASNIDIDQLGFSGVFQKPIYPATLVSALKKTLGL
ncbi:MAG: response regulator [Spirochaetes bacterium]|nr:response regulator [Spirochaetota bacterium]